MRNIIFAVVIIAAAFFVIVYDQKRTEDKANAKSAEAEAKKRMEENAEKVAAEKEDDAADKDSLVYRMRGYDYFDGQQKYRFWLEIFNECNTMRAVVDREKNKSGRTFPEQAREEAAFYIQKGRHPKDYIKNC